MPAGATSDHEAFVSSRDVSYISIDFLMTIRAMPRRLPPLNALKAFEAAARHESFTRAADELCVTQGAVSQQVKALEVSLGITLFDRERQRLVITPAGREYLAVIRDALDRIAMGTERLVQSRGSGVLTVSTSPDFAAKWLVNRLGRFVECHPEIDLRVSATTHHVDFVREDIDIAVRHGDGKWPGLDAVRLCSEQLFPVCSPQLLSGRRCINTASDLLNFPLLRLEDSNAWTRWFEAAGVANAVVRGPTLNRASMLIDAAVDGQGIALARTALAARDMLNGRLIKPIDVSLRMANTYWIVCPKAASTTPKIETFRRWLLGEAAEDRRRLGRPGSKQRGRQ
jgi:LysR family transcriptional regulator, glycine cleavage system transcriptional activator